MIMVGELIATTISTCGTALLIPLPDKYQAKQLVSSLLSLALMKFPLDGGNIRKILRAKVKKVAALMHSLVFLLN